MRAHVLEYCGHTQNVSAISAFVECADDVVLCTLLRAYSVAFLASGRKNLLDWVLNKLMTVCVCVCVCVCVRLSVCVCV